jgi:hypothetical protein
VATWWFIGSAEFFGNEMKARKWREKTRGTRKMMDGMREDEDEKR